MDTPKSVAIEAPESITIESDVYVQETISQEAIEAIRNDTHGIFVTVGINAEDLDTLVTSIRRHIRQGKGWLTLTFGHPNQTIDFISLGNKD